MFATLVLANPCLTMTIMGDSTTRCPLEMHYPCCFDVIVYTQNSQGGMVFEDTVEFDFLLLTRITT